MRILNISLGMHQTAFINAINAWAEATGGRCELINWRAFENDPYTLNQNIIATARGLQPEVCIMQLQTGGIFRKEASDYLHSIGCFIIDWCGDLRTDNSHHYEIAELVDLKLHSNMKDVHELRDKGYKADYLQIGVDTDFYTPGPSSGQYPPIVFLGNHYAGRFPESSFRLKMVEALRHHFGDDFGVYGSGYPFPTKALGPVEERQCYRDAKIFINADHFVYEKFASDRLLRGMACGSMALTRWFPDMDKEYTDGVHLRSWDTIEELIDMIEHYLPDPMCDQIASQGSAWIQRTATWEVRMERMKELYKKYK